MNKGTWFMLHEGPFIMAVDLFGVVDGHPTFVAHCENCGALFAERLPE